MRKPADRASDTKLISAAQFWGGSPPPSSRRMRRALPGAFLMVPNRAIQPASRHAERPDTGTTSAMTGSKSNLLPASRKMLRDRLGPAPTLSAKGLNVAQANLLKVMRGENCANDLTQPRKGILQADHVTPSQSNWTFAQPYRPQECRQLCQSFQVLCSCQGRRATQTVFITVAARPECRKAECMQCRWRTRATGESEQQGQGQATAHGHPDRKFRLGLLTDHPKAPPHPRSHAIPCLR
jgi:hypothetical protein